MHLFWSLNECAQMSPKEDRNGVSISTMKKNYVGREEIIYAKR